MPDVSRIAFRAPTTEDGSAVYRLVERTGILDLNSCYLYLLLCTEYADTCVVAEGPDGIAGVVTGMRLPARPESIFAWQVGVDPQAQGAGLGKRLLRAFLERPGARGATALETTISPGNAASQALFRAIAREHGAEVSVRAYFRTDHFPPGHDAEQHYHISPLR